MLFTIQAYLEEYFNKRNIIDTDGYAVRLANMYFYYRSEINDMLFISKVGRIKTVIYLNNAIDNRKEFELSLIHRLDKKFKKKLCTNSLHFPGGTEVESKRLRQVPKLSVEILLNEFSSATESRGIDAFWKSRKQGILQHKPEKIGQALFSLFTKGALVNRSGIVLREFQSGIGFVDVGIIFSSILHLVEIKVMTDGFTGLSQLEQYMKAEKRKEGSLLIFDSLKPDKKIEIPTRIVTPTGLVKIYSIDINPFAPSSLNR